MKIEKIKTETYVLTDLDRLDPVTLYVTNYEKGKGKIVIECYGSSWSYYWGAMGNNNIQSFFVSCDDAYILNKLLNETTETDFEEIQRRSNGAICATTDVEIAMMAEDMAEHFGDEWYMDLPRCATVEYDYLGRIVDAIKEAFNDELSRIKTLESHKA
jgi:hypothetical protein